jgi:uncharacterized protein (DUF1800 family)
MTLEPFRPTVDEPFDLARAAHLARRAGFGAPRAELERLVGLGLEGAVAEFVDAPAADPVERDLRAAGAPLRLPEYPLQAAEAVAILRSEWVFRLAHARWPLREKLALFWHDHFATAESKVVREPILRRQLETFRWLGLGRFRELVGALARDPAMLVYLDNRQSKKEHPNENWARELLELFTLGVGHYTEEDVRELARVFTGWTTPAKHPAEFAFDPEMHDAGDKRVLGRTIRGRDGAAGIEEGDEALDLLAAHPQCARWLAGKLAAAFMTHAPAPELVEALAERFRQTGGSTQETLRTLFLSRAFFAPEARFALFKSPLELAVSAVRLLGAQNAHQCGLERALERMGMRLLEPPSVAGWEQGPAWIQASTLLERFELALTLSELAHATRPVAGGGALDYDALADGAADERPEALVDAVAEALLQRALRPETRAALVVYASRTAAQGRERLRGLVHLCLCTPEFACA